MRKLAATKEEAKEGSGKIAKLELQLAALKAADLDQVWGCGLQGVGCGLKF